MIRILGPLVLVALLLPSVLAPAQPRTGAPPAPDVRVLVERGLAQMEAGQGPQAEATFKDVLQRDPANLTALVSLGEIALAQKDLARAEGHLRLVEKFKPDHPQAVALRGLIHEARGQAKEAEAAWKRAVSLEPSFLPAHMLLTRQFLQQGRVDEAVEQLRAAARVAPRDDKIRESLVQVLMNAGRNPEAQKELEPLVKARPRNPALVNTLGALKGRQGDTRGAREAFEQALRLDPRFAPAHLNLADSYVVDRDFDKALAHYLKAGELAPGLSLAHERAGDVYLRMGRVDEAAAALRRAIQSDPNGFTALCQLAHLFTDYRPDLPQALDLAQRAEKRSPRSWLTQDTLGWTLYRMGRNDEAIRRLEAARGLDPRAGRVRYHLGVAYLRAGRKEPGLAELRSALEVAPGAVYALEVRRILDKGGL